MPSYSELMIQTDREGLNRSYMSSEETFHALQEMEKKNLVVPLVGDFAGPKAIRAVGEYLRDPEEWPQEVTFAGRLMRTLLFATTPWDLPTLVGVAALLAVAALVASFVPARRAASVNPIEALRVE